MNSTLKMLLPTMLPTAMSAWPASPACTLTAISGALVPKATTVRPITSGEIPNRAARRAAPRTSNTAPAASSTSPRTNKPRTVGSIFNIPSKAR